MQAKGLMLKQEVYIVYYCFDFLESQASLLPLKEKLITTDKQQSKKYKRNVNSTQQ